MWHLRSFKFFKDIVTWYNYMTFVFMKLGDHFFFVVFMDCFATERKTKIPSLCKKRDFEPLHSFFGCNNIHSWRWLLHRIHYAPAPSSACHTLVKSSADNSRCPDSLEVDCKHPPCLTPPPGPMSQLATLLFDSTQTIRSRSSQTVY